MQKPVIFFSHSSQDKKALICLKDLFIAKTGGTIDVFLSSDGQSIQFGRNWVHRIEEALNESKIMVVFITPHSQKSGWIYFEAGFAYSKGINVIPVGFMGMSIGDITPLLNLLQGFNISSEDGLNNLLAIANTQFNHHHVNTFSNADYSEILGQTSFPSNNTFGEFGSMFHNIKIHLSSHTGLKISPEQAIATFDKILTSKQIEHHCDGHSISMFGIKLSTTKHTSPEPLDFEIDPTLADIALPTVELLLQDIFPTGMQDINIRFELQPSIDIVPGFHKITARLFGTNVKIIDEKRLGLGDIEFQLDHLLYLGRSSATRGNAYINITIKSIDIKLQKLAELFNLLFDREVLYISPSA